MRKLGLSVVASLDQGDTINQWHSRFNPWSPGSEPRALPTGPAKSTTVHLWPWSGVSLEKKAWMSPRPADSEPGSWERCLGKVAGQTQQVLETGKGHSRPDHLMAVFLQAKSLSPPQIWEAWTPTSSGNHRRAGRQWPSSCLCPRRWRGRCSWR